MTWQKLVALDGSKVRKTDWEDITDSAMRDDLLYADPSTLQGKRNPWHLVLDEEDVKVMMNSTYVILYRRST